MKRDNSKIYLLFLGIIVVLLHFSTQNALAACGWWCASSQISGNFCSDSDATSPVGKISCMAPPSSCAMCPDPGGGGGGSCTDYSSVSSAGCYCDSSYSCDLDCFDGYNSYCGCDPECAAPPPPPTATPTPTPTPNPANFKATNLYLTDQAGGKHYNFAENTNIFWHADVLNNGDSTATTANNRIYMNLYENQEADITSFTSNHTNTYIDTDDNWAVNASRGFSSADGGNRMDEFSGPEGRAFKRVGSETNNGDPLFARIMVDNNDAQNETPGSELTDNQMYYRYVIGDPNLAVSSFSLTDNTGANTTAFDIGENIFPKVTLANIGDATAISKDPTDLHTYTWFYSNEPTSVATNTVGDTGVEMKNGEFGPNTSYNYYCRPSPGSRCSAYFNQLAWDLPAKGVYTARVFLNFDHGVVETQYADNQAIVEYSVGYTISGRVYADMNKNNGYNAGIDFPLDNVTVTFTGPNDSGTAITGSDGKYTSPTLEPGTYLISTNASNDYAPTNTYPRSSDFTSRADLTGQDIRYFPKYSISGNVFVDSDDSLRKNGAETNYAASPGILMSNYPSGAPNPIITNNLDGSYTLTGLISGQYTVRYPNLPTGYIMNHPQNGPPASFVAPVGSVCAEATPAPGGTCSNGNLIDLNFAIKRGLPWWQAYGLDVRFDSGLNNPVPPSPDVSCTGAYAMLPASSSTPGIAATGNTPGNFWQGNVSSTGWLVGGAAYPEIFTPSNGTLIQTSYGYLQSVLTQSNITPVNLTTVCANLNSCTLPGSLANGIYQADSAVTLNSFTASANRDIVILVHGDLTLKGTLRVPTTSTVFYSVSGSITVDPTLGVTAACPAPAIGSGDLEGFFSADQNFSVPSGSSTNPATADCSASPSPIPDKQLNVQGAIVVNAGGTGGNFINSRDLCTDNINFPSFSIRERPDMILNAPDFLRVPNFIWQEVAP